MNPFRSLRDYEVWIYSLSQRFSAIAESSLTSTDPHHKHIPPDIKHHRVPVPGLSFNRPDLPLLIEEIGHDLLTR